MNVTSLKKALSRALSNRIYAAYTDQLFDANAVQIEALAGRKSTGLGLRGVAPKDTTRLPYSHFYTSSYNAMKGRIRDRLIRKFGPVRITAREKVSGNHISCTVTITQVGTKAIIAQHTVAGKLTGKIRLDEAPTGLVVQAIGRRGCVDVNPFERARDATQGIAKGTIYIRTSTHGECTGTGQGFASSSIVEISDTKTRTIERYKMEALGRAAFEAAMCGDDHVDWCYPGFIESQPKEWPPKPARGKHYSQPELDGLLSYFHFDSPEALANKQWADQAWSRFESLIGINRINGDFAQAMKNTLSGVKDNAYHYSQLAKAGMFRDRAGKEVNQFTWDDLVYLKEKSNEYTEKIKREFELYLNPRLYDLDGEDPQVLIDLARDIHPSRKDNAYATAIAKDLLDKHGIDHDRGRYHTRDENLVSAYDLSARRKTFSDAVRAADKKAEKSERESRKNFRERLQVMSRLLDAIDPILSGRWKPTRGNLTRLAKGIVRDIGISTYKGSGYYVSGRVIGGGPYAESEDGAIRAIAEYFRKMLDIGDELAKLNRDTRRTVELEIRRDIEKKYKGSFWYPYR